MSKKFYINGSDTEFKTLEWMLRNDAGVAVTAMEGEAIDGPLDDLYTLVTDAELEPDILIVTRHAGLLEWLADRYGITGEVIDHVDCWEQVCHRIVFGVLPLYLAAQADQIWVVDMPKMRADQRGADLTPDEMDDAGAELNCYSVAQLLSVG